MTDTLDSFMPELVKIRHTIHQHPELGFEEFETSALVSQKLKEWGYDVHTEMAKTAVIGTIRIGNSSKSIGLRADMDALPIQEQSNKPWVSVIPEKMHACGHDGHTTMLLGAAWYLAKKRQFNGTLHLIFQPAEEALNGGGVMVEEGLFTQFPCDVIFGMHNMPGLPTGHFYFQPGPFMASIDVLNVKVHGYGGHGAMPQKTVDPVVISAYITTALQTIVSRDIDPLQPCVLTVGSIISGNAANVIPAEATMKISMRALNRDVRLLMIRRIKELVNNIAAGFGASATIDHMHNSPALVNNEPETRIAYEAALKRFGNERVHWGLTPSMASEDFANMLEAHPQGSYMIIGNGEKGDGACMVHNPSYDFNDSILVDGSKMWVSLVETYLC